MMGARGGMAWPTAFVLVASCTMGCGGSGADAGVDSGGGGTDATPMGTDAAGTDAAPPVECGADITLDLTVTDIVIDDQVIGATVELYTLADTVTPLAVGVSDADGLARLCLSAAVLEPYIMSAAPGYKVSYQYEADVTGDDARELVIVSEGTWDMAHAFVLIPQDPTTGVVLARAEDSGGVGLPDLVASVLSGGTVVYLDAGGLPDGSLNETDFGGEFGVYGVPPGLTTVQAIGIGLGGSRDILLVADSAHLVTFIVGPVVCGNGTLEPGEECDDGNVMPGDGCDDLCQMEP